MPSHAGEGGADLGGGDGTWVTTEESRRRLLGGCRGQGEDGVKAEDMGRRGAVEGKKEQKGSKWEGGR